MVNKAKSIHLECYTLDGIKNYNQTTAEPQNDIKKPKIFKENDKNKSKNLFMQDLSEVNDLCLPKPDGFRVYESRNNIFETGTDTGSKFSKRDAYSDKLIDLTRPMMNREFNSEIASVNDQIAKLSIAGNISVNSRSTQIMKNVFRTTVRNDKFDQDATTVASHCVEQHNSNRILSDKNNSDVNNRNVRRRLEVIDEIDLDIGTLNVTENNIEKSRNIIKVSGINMLNNQFNLDEYLERFYIKNAVVENRVKSRFDEWMCRLDQTMEGVLTEILLGERNKLKKTMPPCGLCEAIQLTGETFKNQPFLKSIIDKFSIKLLDCSTNKGKLNKVMEPNDLMKLIGLSMILIQHLKEIVNYKELDEAEYMLIDLIKNIEDPKSDIDLSLEKLTPIFSRSEISDERAPLLFRKSRNDKVEYLKKLFASWQTHETNNLTNAAKDKTINEEANIVRTCGKDLNTLKISNTKGITVENKKADKADVANQPKVIRNLKIIPAFEERLKNKAVLDINQHGYEQNLSIYTVSSDEDFQLNNGNYETNHYTVDDLSVSACSVNTERARTSSSFVKMFLVTLKSTLIKISDFINTTTQECREGLCIGRKADLLTKAELMRQCVLKISGRLKNIIARESGDGKTVKDLLIKAGNYAEEDLTMKNYGQTITKFLEQTQILEDVLGDVLTLLRAVNAKVKEEPL